MTANAHSFSSIGIYFEHPDWYRPLFAELERRGVPYENIPIGEHFYDIEESHPPYSLVFNRMSPSAYLRGGESATFYTQGYVEHLERLGVRVINGSTVYGYEINKARQLSLLRSLGLEFPAARVIHSRAQAPLAAEGLRFPVVVKANIGGSGAGIVRYDTPGDLKRAAEAGEIALGIDHTALVQEYVTPCGRADHARRNARREVPVRDPRLHDRASFNLCPADICQTTAASNWCAPRAR
jgi:hypothetical protein